MAEIHDFEAARGRFRIRPTNDWPALLMTNENRSFKGNLANAAVVFCNCPEFAGKIGTDVRSRAIVTREDTAAGPAGPWSDAHTTAATRWIQLQHIPVRYADVDKAVGYAASLVPVDMLGDWLRGLVWDGIERIGSWLSRYCGAEESVAASMIGSKFLIGAVARGLRPGCRMDYMMVFEGDQGTGKSTAVKVLGAEWTAENLTDFSSRDSMQVACTKWFVEVGELAAMRKSDLEVVKSFLTRTEDTYVPKYAKYPVTVQRSAVLIGNINPGENGYLTDITGNRRFWPVKVGTIDTDGLRNDRAQLFAEAVICYQRGDPWWIENAEQRTLMAAEQDLRLEHDEWEAIIARYLVEIPTVDRLGKVHWEPRVQPLANTTTTNIAVDALQIPHGMITRAAQTRIGIAMKRLGFDKKRVAVDGYREWQFTRP